MLEGPVSRVTETAPENYQSLFGLLGKEMRLDEFSINFGLLLFLLHSATCRCPNACLGLSPRLLVSLHSSQMDNDLENVVGLFLELHPRLCLYQ